MKYNLKIYIYLDGNYEEKWVTTLATLGEISAKLVELEGQEDRIIEKEIKIYEQGTDAYTPSKIRKEDCYLRYEIYPVLG